MASQRPRRNASPASSKPQPMRATLPFSLIRNPSPTRGNGLRRPSPSSSPVFVGENGFKPRRNSPETRGSPEHRRSPSSPSLASSKSNLFLSRIFFMINRIFLVFSAGDLLLSLLSFVWPSVAFALGKSRQFHFQHSSVFEVYVDRGSFRCREWKLEKAKHVLRSFIVLPGERTKTAKSSSVSSIRRTSSLDAISGPYLSCQWPREVGNYGQSVCHKATQVS